MASEDYSDYDDDAGEINHLIHEGRAEKRGLTWNREKYRFETPAGQPIKFTDKDTWVVISEAEWDVISAPLRLNDA